MNPYKILNIDHRASKKDIIGAAALAQRKREYSGQEIAAAQRELLDPITKAAHDFIRFLDINPVRPSLPAHTGITEPIRIDLKRLPVFDQKP